MSSFLFYAAIILPANGPTDVSRNSAIDIFNNTLVSPNSPLYSVTNVNIDFSFSAMKYLWTDQTFLSATGVVATMHQELKMAPGGGGKMGIS